VKVVETSVLLILLAMGLTNKRKICIKVSRFTPVLITSTGWYMEAVSTARFHSQTLFV